MNTESIEQECQTCHKHPPYCLCVAKPAEASIVPTDGDNFELSATNPEEMVQCHKAAIEWCRRKIEIVSGEAKELKEAFEHAKERKWKSGTLEKHWKLALKRVSYFEKIMAAFQAGYYIVPNFPVTLFAIRTNKPNPKRMWARLRWEGGQNFEQKAAVLPQGEGEYKNPNPVIEKLYGSMISKPGESDTWAFQAESWADLEFPANMARVQVMEAATRAMDSKIFDEVGFLPQDHKRNPDPLLIGIIIDPKPMRYGEPRRISFIIAWHIDTRTI